MTGTKIIVVQIGYASVRFLVGKKKIRKYIFSATEIFWLQVLLVVLQSMAEAFVDAATTMGETMERCFQVHSQKCAAGTTKLGFMF